MEISVVIQNNFPNDREIRTEKITKSINTLGHSATILARNSQTDPGRGTIHSDSLPAEEVLPYATVRRFSWMAGTRFGSVVLAPIPFNPFWLLWMTLEFRRQKPDLVIAADLRAGLTAVIAARVFGIPIIVDLRENFPEFAKQLSSEGFVDAVTMNPRFVAFLERVLIRLSDHVWVVIEEKKWALVERGVPNEKISIVSNTPLRTDVSEDTECPYPEDSFEGFSLVYAGLINDFRGLDLMIDGVDELVSKGQTDVYLIIAGDGPHREQLERKAAELAVTDNVLFTGWIDSEQIPAFLKSGDIGVIPHRVNGYTHTTVPNKLFDYMAAGLPVLTTNAAPIRRIVRDVECGRVLPSNPTGEDVAEAVTELRKSDSFCDYVDNGRDAIDDRFNWDRETDQIRADITALTEG